MVKGILFDLDGTLINTNELIIDSYKHTFKIHLNMEIEREDIVKTFGEPLEVTMEKYSMEKAKEMVKTYRDFNESIHDERVSTFKGVEDALKLFKKNNLKMAIVTSKRKVLAERGLKVSNLYDYIDAIITPEDTKEHKPLAEPVLKGCEKLGLQPSEVIMVGDSHNDILSGKNAGVKTCLVKYTALNLEDLKKLNPDYVVDDLSELMENITI